MFLIKWRFQVEKKNLLGFRRPLEYFWIKWNVVHFWIQKKTFFLRHFHQVKLHWVWVANILTAVSNKATFWGMSPNVQYWQDLKIAAKSWTEVSLSNRCQNLALFSSESIDYNIHGWLSIVSLRLGTELNMD